jgi:2-succinyl-5-enolpyruvyl-6-hydroxy-3-cyclohexene-1-carboxylate synthase
MTAPAPAQALAEVLVDELVRGGVREAVLCPGSRNAPLSYALQAAHVAGRLRLHVRIDERTAGFLALGLSRGCGGPVPVCCTSGTAVANLHPALVEAGESGIGILALTADRPAHLRGTGANQTIDQVGIFGTAVVLAHDLPAPATATAADNAAWRSLVCRALAAAADGPVHLNIQFADPLTPTSPASTLPAELAGRAHGRAWTRPVRPDPYWTFDAPPAPRRHGDLMLECARTLVVLGDGATPDLHRVATWAGRAGYPVIAEPSSWWAAREVRLAAGAVLLSCTELLDAAPPVRVVVAGRPTLGRLVGALVRRPGVELSVVGSRPGWADPEHLAETEVRQVDDLASAPVDDNWAQSWKRADVAAATRRDTELAVSIEGAALASVVGAAAAAAGPSGIGLLVAASSQAIRDLDTAGPPAGNLRVLANRGAAGIDGTLSTAVGAALADQAAGGGRAFALVGDLAFVHDLNGLVIGPGEPRPDLTVVVADDDGGAIFATLEYGAPERTGSAADAAVFERVFGTPTGVDIPALCAGVGVPCVSAADRAGVEKALADTAPGLRVVHVRTDRTRRRRRDAELRAAVQAAVAHAVSDGPSSPDA